MRASSRGYVLMIVIVMGVVLASLAGTLLYAVTRDRTEAKLQTSSVRAVYASEAAVAVGIERLRTALEESVSPDLAAVETAAKTAAVSALPGATFPTLSVRYFDATTNTTSSTPFGTTALTTITSGPNTGLRAQQTPIQVFAVAQVDKAMASVADAIRVDLIPVFQFAMFFDGDLETQRPAEMNVSGRVHTNGGLYLSNSGDPVRFTGTVTAAGYVRSHTIADASVKVGTAASATSFFSSVTSAQVAVANNLRRSTDADQKSYLQSTFGVSGGLQDVTTGVTPLSIPLRLTSATTCSSNANCLLGQSCVKVRVTDQSGVCTNDVVSRPSKCGNGTTDASFSQSLAVELVKRPKADYSGVLGKPYNLPYSRDDTSKASPYGADFGPRPAQVESGAARTTTGTNSDADDMLEIAVDRRIPVVTSAPADDDPGAISDRLYWKAHIRIIDGVWYKGNSIVPVFNPELDAPGLNNPDPTSDMNHAFARVLRYSWWWDARESRVYCEGADAASNCVTDGNEYQRGAQIRATDFDMAAFMALLERSDARAKLFSGGTIPTGGIIVYISETYDPRYEDANTKVERAANVRNFLNFPVMHNHLTSTAIAGLAGVTRKSPATAYVAAVPATPHQLGWFPENIWGRNVSTLNMESLTRPTGIEADFYASPPPGGSKNSSTCAVPGSDFPGTRRPSARPTSFATARVVPTCIQAGAQPLGPENAVRVVRAHTMPSQGFTLVTDNRLYIHGDVNTRSNSTVVSGGFQTSQDISGKFAFIADSLTIQSERFDDRRHQAAVGATAPNYSSFFRTPDSYAAAAFTAATITDRARALPYSRTASSAGSSANLCNALFNDNVTSAFETRINASFLMGDVPPCPSSSSALGNLGGGVNNFPRFVERWETTLMLNGSMVGLFRSERGNARFLSAKSDGTGTIRQARSANPWGMVDKDICDYRPPNRNWTFDNTLLNSVENLPPGTPRVVATDRLRWVRR